MSITREYSNSINITDRALIRQIVQIPAPLTPDELGRKDAREGWPFAPDSYYARRNDCALYAVGFLAVQPDNACALAYMAGIEAQAEEDHENVMAEIAMQRGY